MKKTLLILVFILFIIVPIIIIFETNKIGYVVINIIGFCILAFLINSLEPKIDTKKASNGLIVNNYEDEEEDNLSEAINNLRIYNSAIEETDK